LEKGMKVKVTIRFRGREATYPELALEDLRGIAEELKDVSVVETAPLMEGRSMTLVLAPTKEKEKEKKAAPKKKQPENTEKTEKKEPPKKVEKAKKVEKPKKTEKVEKTDKTDS
jgi:translation initiation factor IF-3